MALILVGEETIIDVDLMEGVSKDCAGCTQTKQLFILENIGINWVLIKALIAYPIHVYQIWLNVSTLYVFLF